MKFEDTQEQAEIQLYLKDSIEEKLHRLIKQGRTDLLFSILVELSLQEKSKEDVPSVHERIKIFEKIDDGLGELLHRSSKTVH